MALITGTPLGLVDAQEDLYIDGAPNVFFQDYTASLLNNPDADGFYYGLSGTTTYHVQGLGCVENLQLADNLTMNDIRCDTDGVVDVIQRRNYLELTLTVSTIFPLSSIREILHAGPVTLSGEIEKMGLGQIDQGKRFHLWMPMVYDQDNGDWLAWALHKCKFVDAWQIGFRYGQQWQITNGKSVV